MFVTGPNVVKTVTHEDVDAEFLGGATTHTTRSGVAHLAARDEATRVRPVARAARAPAAEQSGRRRRRRRRRTRADRCDAALDTIVPDDPRQPYDMHEVLDAHRRRRRRSSRSSRAGRANIIVGLRAARRPERRRSSRSSRRSSPARSTSMRRSRRRGSSGPATAFNVPLVTFVDVPGFLPGVDQEHGGIIRHGAKLLYAYCEATVPKLTVITRKAYGGAYDVMSSKHIRGDMNFAWPTAEIAVMGAEGAVNIIYRDEIAAAADPAAERARLVAAYEARVRQPVHRRGARLRRRRHPAVRDAAAADPRPGDAGRQARRQPAKEAWQHPALTAAPDVFAQRRATGDAARRRRSDRVLVANRGEIAVRIIRACHELGHGGGRRLQRRRRRRAATSGWPTSPSGSGPRPPPRATSRIDAIVEAARAPAPTPIHPGLRLPRPSGRRSPGRVEDAGLVFVGPPADDDRGARATSWPRAGWLGRSASPVVPGTLEPVAVDRPDAVAGDRRRGGADRLPAAGQGGGRRRWTRDAAGRRGRGPARGAGRRLGRGAGRVRRRSGLPGARDPTGPPHRGPAPRRRDGARSSPSASATARSSAATRSCVEEAPAPGPDARRAARPPRRWRSGSRRRPGSERRDRRVPAGTPTARFCFLEVNTRLQVEHGVTELVERPRHRPRAVLAGGRRPLSAGRRGRRGAGRGADRPRDRGPARRRGPGPRLRARARDGSAAGSCRPGRASGSTPALRGGDRVPPDYDNLVAKIMVDRRGPRRPPSIACGGRSTRRRSRASRRPCRSIGSWPAHAGVPGRRAVDRLGRRALGWRGGAGSTSSAPRSPRPSGPRPMGRAGQRRTRDGRPGQPLPASRRWASAARADAIDRWPTMTRWRIVGPRRPASVTRRRADAADGLDRARTSSRRRAPARPAVGRPAVGPRPDAARGRRRRLAVRVRGRGCGDRPPSATARRLRHEAAVQHGPTEVRAIIPGRVGRGGRRGRRGGQRRPAAPRGGGDEDGERAAGAARRDRRPGGRRPSARPSSSATRWSSSDDRASVGPPTARPRPRGTRSGPRPLARDPPGEGPRGRPGAARAASRRRPGIEIRDLYTPADTAGLDEDRDLGRPGEYPFTRGVQPTMYRSRFWTMRQYAGLRDRRGDQPRASGTSSSRARPGCRSPSTCRPRWATTPTRREAEGEVGRVGVPISSLADMEVLLDGLPLGEVSTSMTINATAPILLALYVAAAEAQGVPRAAIGGTIQNDILKEYIARGTYIYPPRPSMRLVTDVFEFCADRAAALEHDLDLGLPHARGRGDRGPGARLHARRRDRLRRGGASPGASTSTTSPAASPSSSPPGPSSSRRSPSSGSPAGCGRRSCASGSGPRTRARWCAASTSRPPAPA